MTAESFSAAELAVERQRIERQTFAYDTRDYMLRWIATVDRLQEQLDTRAADLGRLTQESVTSVKRLEGQAKRLVTALYAGDGYEVTSEAYRELQQLGELVGVEEPRGHP